MADKIVMFTDGGSRGNPGPAAIGVYVETLDKKYGETIGTKTNNEAEYAALIFGLKKIKQLVGKAKAKSAEVECFLDSELVVNQMNHKYKLSDEKTQRAFLEIWNLMLDYKSVKFAHVPREKNKIADALVNKALDGKIGQGTIC